MYPVPPDRGPIATLIVLLWAALLTAQVADKRVAVPFTDGVSVTDFGAVPDATTDSTAAIQSAIDDVSANPTHGRVRFPSGKACYKVTAPLKIRAPSVRLEGESWSNYGAGTCLVAAGFAGPMIHAAVQAANDLPFTASLAAGPGRALLLSTATQDTATYVDLQDAASARLDGLSAFTAELFFRVDSNNPNYPTLWASSGSLSRTDPTHSAFAFDFNDTLHLSGHLNIGGTVHSITSDALRVSQVYHAAITYDGSNVRLFVGVPGATSTLVGTRAATGVITQGPYEQLPVGGRRAAWPHGERFSDVVNGAVDSLRLSSSARYTTTYTVPATKLGFDGNTRLLENFDNETIDFSIVQTSFGPMYLPKNSTLPGILGYLEIAHLNLMIGPGIGMWLHGVYLSSFHHLGLAGGVFGISGREANFLNSFSNLHLDSLQQPYAKAGIALSTNNEIVSIRDSSFSNWPTAVATTNAGGGEMANLFVHGRLQVFPIIVSFSYMHLDSIFCSNEDADPATYKADIRLNDNRSIVITGGKFERFTNAGPAIQIDGGGSLTLIAPWFPMHTRAREVIEVLSAPSKKILILNGEVTPDTVPWSTTPGAISALP